MRRRQGHRAYLGIAARGIEPELARVFRLPVDSGLLVESVGEGSPADKAGIRAGETEVAVAGVEYALGGDVIVAVDGVRVTELGGLLTCSHATSPATPSSSTSTAARTCGL